MANEVQIILKAADQASAVFKGLQDNFAKTGQSGGAFSKVLSGVNNSMPAIIGGVTALAAGVKLVTGKFDQATEQLANYTRQVRELSMTIGSTPEEASKLIQVADDMEVEFGQLEIAMKRAIQKGLTPTIEGIGQLSDEYLALAPGIERTKFLMDTFGRSGADVARLMELGSQKINEMGNSVENTALIINEQGVKAYEDYYAATDRLNDATTQVSNSIGNAWMGIKTSVANAISPIAEAIAKAVSFEDALKNAYKQGYISLEAYDRLFVYSWHNQEEGFKQLNAIIEVYKKAHQSLAKATDESITGLSEYTRVAKILGGAFDVTTDKLSYFSDAEEVAMQMALMGVQTTDKYTAAMFRLGYALDATKAKLEGAKLDLDEIKAGMEAGVRAAMGWGDQIESEAEKVEEALSWQDIDLGLADAIMAELEKAMAVLESPEFLKVQKLFRDLMNPERNATAEEAKKLLPVYEWLAIEAGKAALSTAEYDKKMRALATAMGIAYKSADDLLRQLLLLAGYDGETFSLDFVVRYIQSGGTPEGLKDLQEITKRNRKKYKESDDTPGLQTGANFVVPPGYENDTFNMRVSSGERVVVVPRSKRKQIPIPAYSNEIGGTFANGEMNQNIVINIPRGINVFSYVQNAIAALSNYRRNGFYSGATAYGGQ